VQRTEGAPVSRVSVSFFGTYRGSHLGGRTAHAVAAGEAEIGLASISTFADLPQGVESLGPLPPELQHYNVVAGAISASAREADAGKALLTFLTSPDAAPVLKAKGLEPAVY